MKVIRLVMFTDINICAGGSWSFLVPLSQNKMFVIFFSSLGQNKSSLQGTYGGGGQGEAFPLESLHLRQGEQRAVIKPCAH